MLVHWCYSEALVREFILRSICDQATELYILSKDVGATVVVWKGRNSSEPEGECSCRCCFMGNLRCLLLCSSVVNFFSLSCTFFCVV